MDTDFEPPRRRAAIYIRKPGTEEYLLLFSWFPYKNSSQKVVMLRDSSAKGFDTDEREFLTATCRAEI